MFWMRFWALLSVILGSFRVTCEKDVWKDVKCDAFFLPDNCDFSRIPVLTVEDYERCAPAYLPLYARNYFLGWGGRGVTYRDNRKAFGRIKIRPKLLRDVSDINLEITTLDQTVSFPVGISPTALQTLAHPEGEIATARAAASMGTVMILGSFSSKTLEDVAEAVKGTSLHLWMHLFFFKNRKTTIDIIKRAERSGYEAIVLSVDVDVFAKSPCDAKNSPELKNVKFANAPESFESFSPGIVTFKDITWLTTLTKLPIIAKGILRVNLLYTLGWVPTGILRCPGFNPNYEMSLYTRRISKLNEDFCWKNAVGHSRERRDDAKMAIQAGASAIFVSNYGGRQVDGDPATIDALPEVVAAVNKIHPGIDVYVDGGVRNGFDVYKALARGARMAFIGRPSLWGLTIKGEEGVKDVLSIIKREFNETMFLSGSACPDEISSDTVVPANPIYGIDCAD